MTTVKMTDSLYWVGVMNPSLRVFDIVMRTDYGTTYNSYLLRGSEKTVLIEGCHKTYFQHWLDNIQQVCDVSEIDAVILNHNEPDHTGAVAKLLELNPNMEVICSQAGSIYIKGITNRTDLKLRVVKDGDTMDIGGKTLKFLAAPFLHWPDSIFTWVEEDQVLFTCDFLGCHYCEPFLYDYNIARDAAYEEAFKGYYDAIFGPFPSYVVKGLAKMADLDPKYVCTSHGPVLTREGRLSYVKEMYAKWSAPVEKAVKSVPIFYCSAYGNTRKLADEIRKGILEVLPDADCQTYDIIDHDMGELGAKLNGSDAFAIGSPTLNRDAVPPVWMLLAHVDAVNCAKKPVLLFGSYGWSGEACGNLKSRVEGLKMKVWEELFKVNFVPSEADLEKARNLGRDFAASLD